jgi:pilus assembly protein Flp/PilA
VLKRFVTEDRGATAIEYGLICAGIALVILAAAGMTGDALIALLTTLKDALS